MVEHAWLRGSYRLPEKAPEGRDGFQAPPEFWILKWHPSSQLTDFHGVLWLGTFHGIVAGKVTIWHFDGGSPTAGAVGSGPSWILFKGLKFGTAHEASVLKLLRQKADLERVQGLQVQLEAWYSEG